jgi:hypothetical protein
MIASDTELELLMFEKLLSQIRADSKGGVTPLKRGGVEEKLVKNGVHWQTLGTSTSLRAANEPTRDILPEYGLSRKRPHWKREHSYS